jgi:hypothetical protein
VVHGSGTADISAGNDMAKTRPNPFNLLVQGSSPWRPT